MYILIIIIFSQYPVEIMKLNYQPGFAVRGLHFDIGKGLLLKVDSFHQIQLGCVYRGLQRLSDEEVLSLYGQFYIPADYLESHVYNGSQQVYKKQLCYCINCIVLTLFVKCI